jgi:hypothetical protein
LSSIIRGRSSTGRAEYVVQIGYGTTGDSSGDCDSEKKECVISSHLLISRLSYPDDRPSRLGSPGYN